jgi:hypothetical protein
MFNPHTLDNLPCHHLLVLPAISSTMLPAISFTVLLPLLAPAAASGRRSTQPQAVTAILTDVCEPKNESSGLVTML